MTGQERIVRKRRVFYIPGYDPIPPRRYRELYRKEGKAQADLCEYGLSLIERPKSDRFGWAVEARVDGASVEADFEVLVWSDIVRDSMDASILRTYQQLVRTAWLYIASGALGRLVRLRKGPVIAALYPVGMLLIQLLMAVTVGVIVWRLMAILGVFGSIAGAALGLALVLGILSWFRGKDGRFFAHYLMHDYAFSASENGAYPEALETRLDDFADAVADAAQADVDEVLVVGHSSGAHLAISVLADLLRAGRVEADRVSLLTLGQVVPMVSFLPNADRLRADLRLMAAQDNIAWVDVSAPGDGCTFALCDPVAVSGVAPADKKWPLVLSAAFTKTLQPDTWKALRWRFFRLHFQYLCAFDRPGDYDYFQITAGPRSLRDRYAGRAASRSRIETPVSKFTSVAA